MEMRFNEIPSGEEKAAERLSQVGEFVDKLEPEQKEEFRAKAEKMLEKLEAELKKTNEKLESLKSKEKIYTDKARKAQSPQERSEYFGKWKDIGPEIAQLSAQIQILESNIAIWDHYATLKMKENA
jgi:ABC-type Zn uptake system ZnuABC Zn-binding protein ZnuA